MISNAVQRAMLLGLAIGGAVSLALALSFPAQVQTSKSETQGAPTKQVKANAGK
jgi:hypothetical protein